MYGTTTINHAEYQQRLRSKTLPELRWIIKDATEAMNAHPTGHKAGYYADEVSYASMEITRRNANQGIFRSDPDRFI